MDRVSMSGALRWATVGMAVWLAIIYNNGGEGSTTTREEADPWMCPTPWKSKPKPEEIQSNNVQTGMEDPCSKYDGDACGCALSRNKCDFIVKEERCVTHKRDCGLETSWPGECRREQGFYSVDGRICENLVQSGDCDRDTSAKSNFGVNLNGLEYTDSYNVHYKAQNETCRARPSENMVYNNASHPLTSICKLEGRGTEVEIVSYMQDPTNWDVRNLGWGYVEGAQGHSSQKGNKCLNILLRFKEDGVYELNIKTGEMEYDADNYKIRLFDIKFNDITIFSKVEPTRLAGKPCFVVDLFMNMVVRKGQTEIILGGLAPDRLYRDGTTMLEFCPANCGGRRHPDESWDDNFIAMAASVTKLKAGGEPSGVGTELDSENEIID